MNKTLSDNNLDEIFSEFFALDLKFKKELESLNSKRLKAIKALIKDHNFKKIMDDCYNSAREDIIEDYYYQINDRLGEADVYTSAFYGLYGIQESDGNDEIRDMYQHLYS